jgi:hypothetical protein
LGELITGFRTASAECLRSPAALAASSDAIDQVFHIAVRLAAARLSASADAQITDLETALTATEVALVCSDLLAEVDLDLFELAMWRNWGKA